MKIVVTIAISILMKEMKEVKTGMKEMKKEMKEMKKEMKEMKMTTTVMCAEPFQTR